MLLVYRLAGIAANGLFCGGFAHRLSICRPQKAGAARLLEKADADAGDSAIRTTEGSNDYGVDFVP